MRGGAGRNSHWSVARALGGAFVALICQIPGDGWAQWVYEPGRDEWRGSDDRLALLRSLPRPDADLAGEAFLVFRERRGSVSAFLMYPEERVDCAEAGCEVPARIDGGKVLAVEGGATNERGSIVLRDPKVLLEAVRLGKQLIVELPTIDKGAIQLRFDLTGFEWPQLDRNAPFRNGVGSLRWGDPRPPHFTKFAAPPIGNVSCYESGAPDGELWTKAIVDSARYCFVDSRFAYAAFSSPATKAGREGLRSAVIAAAGPPRSLIADMERWEAQPGAEIVSLALFRGSAGQGPSSSSLLLISYRPLDYFKAD